MSKNRADVLWCERVRDDKCAGAAEIRRARTFPPTICHIHDRTCLLKFFPQRHSQGKLSANNITSAEMHRTTRIPTCKTISGSMKLHTEKNDNDDQDARGWRTRPKNWKSVISSFKLKIQRKVRVVFAQCKFVRFRFVFVFVCLCVSCISTTPIIRSYLFEPLRCITHNERTKVARVLCGSFGRNWWCALTQAPYHAHAQQLHSHTHMHARAYCILYTTSQTCMLFELWRGSVSQLLWSSTETMWHKTNQ